VVNPKPIINAVANNGCVNEPVSFTAQQTDNATNITQWNWTFGNGQTSNQQNPQHTYNNKGTYAVTLTANADNGCSSTVTTIPVFINQAVAIAGNDTIAIKDEPLQLQGSGGVSYIWSPATGLNDATLQNPVAILQDDITYTLTVTTAEGCEDTDEIKITVFKSSAVYVPTGFTPNGDGLNDLMRPYCAGIRQLDYFTVYNRWGQMVFTTKTIGAGWDGVFKGSKQSTGTYIWTLRAVDYAGKVFQLKGMTTLLR
jgi:gliding motility-associated-like protein